MDPIKDYADGAKAEAIAAGKTPEEAEAVRVAAEIEAKAVAESPFHKRFETVARKRFEEHDTLKKEVAPLKGAAAKLKEIEDAAKSDAQKLTDRIAALEPGAARTVALEARIQAILDESMADLTDVQKAAVRGETPEAKLEHLQAMRAAGLFGEQTPGRSPGGQLPGKGNNNTMKRSDFEAKSPAEQNKHITSGGKVID